MKERLDVLLVKRGLAESREKAKAIIMSGNVFVGQVREDKAGAGIDVNAAIEVKGRPMKYVSRGGYKLEKAMECFGIALDGKVCMDVGSSTGGFTDCMLQNGASRVYAIDVGTNQLAWKLRSDERVISMERTNVRYLTPGDIPDEPMFSSVDVSFISLDKILTPVRDILSPQGEMVCLIKPQFEAGREKVGKKGVVRDKGVHEEVISKVVQHAISIGLYPLKLDFSPIKGPEGNIEYLIWIAKQPHEDGGGQEGAVSADGSGQEGAVSIDGSGQESTVSIDGSGQEGAVSIDGCGLEDASSIESSIHEIVERAHTCLNKA